MVGLRNFVIRHGLCHFSAAALLLATTAALSSCIYEGEKPCPDVVPLTVVNDWRACDDAAPGGMAYMFFPDDGSEPWRFDFAGREAGRVALAVGGYRFLSFNDDTYHVTFRGDDGYDTYEAYTPASDLLGAIPLAERGESLPQRADGEMAVGCPDMMWGCAYDAFRLGYAGVRYTTTPGGAVVNAPDFVLTAYQRPLTARYTFRVEDVENLSGVRSMSAALSGMAGAMMLASGHKRAYPSTLTLEASAIDSSTVGGKFCTFGIDDNPTASNTLSLFVVIKDGRRFVYRFDVTDQVRSATPTSTTFRSTTPTCST